MSQMPDKIWLHKDTKYSTGDIVCGYQYDFVQGIEDEGGIENFVEYVPADAFIEKTCEWIKESITNNPECNRIISKKGVITMGELIKDFKNYMKGEYGMDLKNLLEYYLFILNDQSLSYQDKVEVLEGKIKEQLEKM